MTNYSTAPLEALCLPFGTSKSILPPSVLEGMVDAGAAVLWASGAIEGQIGADRRLVAEIFAAMAAAIKEPEAAY